MHLAKKQTELSWSSGSSPIVLSEIFSKTTSVAIWERDFNLQISKYFDRTFASMGLGIKGVFPLVSLKDELSKMLPEEEGKKTAVDDIYLLSDMLTCLFDCDTVGLRLAPLKSAMCPSFHIDNIPVRLVNTYLGTGTDWLPLESLQKEVLQKEALHKFPNGKEAKLSKTNFGMYYDKDHVQQMNTFDVGLLKGKAWQQQEQMAAVHRSCQLQKNEKRVLLTLDPM